MFGLRRVDSRRPWPATSNFIFIKASNSHRQGWNPEVVSVPTYIGADIGTHSRNVRSSASAPSALPPKADIGTQPRDVRFVPKADIAHRSELCALRHARPM